MLTTAADSAFIRSAGFKHFAHVVLYSYVTSFMFRCERASFLRLQFVVRQAYEDSTKMLCQIEQQVSGGGHE